MVSQYFEFYLQNQEVDLVNILQGECFCAVSSLFLVSVLAIMSDDVYHFRSFGRVSVNARHCSECVLFWFIKRMFELTTITFYLR